MAPKKNKNYSFPEPIANAQLVGHMAAQSAFMDAFARRDTYPIHPVWILSGVRGIGKSTLAYRIARFIFKEGNKNLGIDNLNGDLFGEEPTYQSTITDNQSMDIAAEDHVFQKMLTGGLGDFFIIDIAHNIDKDGRSKPDAKQISVHTIRALIEKMQLSSMEGGWRVVLIDSLDEMTAAAQNAMLKLLEEPPASTLFLVVVHSLAATLPTIRSRSRVEKLHPLTTSEIRDLARMFLPADEQDLSPALIKLANGSFGRIAGLKKNGGDELYEELLRICEDPRTNAAEVMTVAAAIARADMAPILLDAVAHFGCADLYPIVAREIIAADKLYLEPEIAAFKVIMKIREVKKNAD